MTLYSIPPPKSTAPFNEGAARGEKKKPGGFSALPALGLRLSELLVLELQKIVFEGAFGGPYAVAPMEIAFAAFAVVVVDED